MVIALPGFRVATDVDADQPCGWPTVNDLTHLVYHFCLLRRKYDTRVAHAAAAESWFYEWFRKEETDGGSALA